MNYRHAYHAGNFADVLKHTALTAVLLHLRKKDTPFVVIDTHGGTGLYDLNAPEAEKTGEADAGILTLKRADDPPEAVRAYLRVVADFGARYPGSPLVAAHLLRPSDRLLAVEKHPEDHKALAAALRPYRRARAIEADGYREMVSALPPPERRGAILIDPSYEEADEFVTAVAALIAGYRRFATGIYLFWYPAKQARHVDAASGELLNAGIGNLMRIELDIGGTDDAALHAAGLLVVNPPYGFGAQMTQAVRFFARVLVRGDEARGTIRRLAGEG